MSGGSRERDGRPWFASLVGTLPLKTAEDASSSGENGLLWSNFHRGEPQTPDFGFVVVGATDSPAPLRVSGSRGIIKFQHNITVETRKHDILRFY